MTEIRNKNHVVVYDGAVLSAEAVRERPGEPWVITKRHYGLPKMTKVATVYPYLPEVLQRKMVLTILEAL